MEKFYVGKENLEFLGEKFGLRERELGDFEGWNSRKW